MKTCLLVLLLLGLCGLSTPECIKGPLKDTLFDGNDVGQIRDQTFDSCQKACTDNSKCEFFSYIPPDAEKMPKYCILKSKASWGMQRRTAAGFWSGYSLRDCLSLVPAPECDKLFPDTNMWNEPIVTLKNTASVEVCHQECEKESRCNFFVYFSDGWTRDYQTRYCYLKSGTPKKIQSLTSVTSGYASRSCKAEPKCDKLYLDTNMWNQPIVTLKNTASAEVCRQECEKESCCNFFVYFGDGWTRDYQTRYCYLKSGTPKKLESLTSVISGYASRSCK